MVPVCHRLLAARGPGSTECIYGTVLLEETVSESSKQERAVSSVHVGPVHLPMMEYVTEPHGLHLILQQLLLWISMTWLVCV